MKRKGSTKIQILTAKPDPISGFAIFRFYSILVAVLLVGATGCKKEPPSTAPPAPVKKEVPSNAGDGVTFINSGHSAIFNLYAPGKKSVYLIGDFNNWQPTAKYAMTNTPDGKRW